MSGLPAIAALVVGIGGTAALVAGGASDPPAALSAYLAALSAWSAVPAGALALLMAARLSGGTWTFAVERALTDAGRTLAPTALLFLPLLLLLPYAYPWAQEGWRGGGQALYLNTPFFSVRALLFLGLWVRLFAWMRRSAGGVPAVVGLLLYVPTASLAGVDWLMSRDPTFNSGAFGLAFILHQLLAAFAVALLAAPLAQASPRQLRALGGLLLAGTMAWIYLAYTQYLVVWTTDLPVEAAWYLKRMDGLWGWAWAAVVLLNGVLPFVALLFPGVRESAGALKMLAAAILLARLIEAAWLVLPSGALLTMAAAVGLGGLWLAAFLALRRV